LVVINDLPRRGRRVGADLVARMRRTIPLDVIGMNSEAVGGLGEISHDDLPRFMSRYRFFFHPVRYTSFGLAVCEAMRIGLPIVAWSVTEMPAVLQDGISGYLGNDPDRLLTTYTSRRRATRPVQGVAERTVESSLNKGTPCAAKLH
jgi:glycosyltransferase involved in cell wall biosynthesis